MSGDSNIERKLGGTIVTSVSCNGIEVSLFAYPDPSSRFGIWKQGSVMVRQLGSTHGPWLFILERASYDSAYKKFKKCSDLLHTGRYDVFEGIIEAGQVHSQEHADWGTF